MVSACIAAAITASTDCALTLAVTLTLTLTLPLTDYLHRSGHHGVVRLLRRRRSAAYPLVRVRARVS